MAPTTIELEKLRAAIAGPQNFVMRPKIEIKELIALWESVLELRLVIEKSHAVMRDEKVFKAWTEVRSQLVRMG